MTPNDASLQEQLSAWMDGELPPDQARFLQRRLENDPELREQWQRWQLASDCLRGHAISLVPPALAANVAAAVAAHPRQRSRWPWLASAVAAVLVFLLPGAPEAPPGPPQLAPAASPVELRGAPAPAIADFGQGPSLAQSPVDAAESVTDFPLVEPEGGRPWPRSPLIPESRSIEPYLVRHNALMAEDGLGGFVSYVDVLAHDADTDADAQSAADEPAQ
jgi:anti-sigma factor RsiW